MRKNDGKFMRCGANDECNNGNRDSNVVVMDLVIREGATSIVYLEPVLGNGTHGGFNTFMEE